MFYTAAWCTHSEADFKKALPLEILGQSLQRFSSKQGVSVIMLEGMEKLSAAYLQSMEVLGFRFVDYTAAFRDIVAAYPSIDRHYSRYERNCFLRWIAFMKICQQEAEGDQFWHLDSDLILHDSLDQLADDTRNKTFMLQGCPVLVSISDFKWFLQYEQHLKKLDQNIADYSEKAYAEKALCILKDRGLFNHSLYRNPIGSDQDLLEYLISSGQILQDSTEKIISSRYYFMQNALAVKHWHSLQAEEKNFFEATENGGIRMGSKRVPFIHYQNTFTRVAAAYLLLQSMRLPDAVKRRVLRFRIADEHFHTGYVFRLIAKINTKWHGNGLRGYVMAKMSDDSKNPPIIGLLNLLLTQ